MSNPVCKFGQGDYETEYTPMPFSEEAKRRIMLFAMLVAVAAWLAVLLVR